MWLQSKSRSSRKQEGDEGMESWDDGCAALVLCPLTKTLISVCVIPHCLLRLLILINYIHLPLPLSIPFSHPPSLCPPKITYWLSEPHLDQTCFYSLSPSVSLWLSFFISFFLFLSTYLHFLYPLHPSVLLHPTCSVCCLIFSPWKKTPLLFLCLSCGWLCLVDINACPPLRTSKAIYCDNSFSRPDH